MAFPSVARVGIGICGYRRAVMAMEERRSAPADGMNAAAEKWELGTSPSGSSGANLHRLAP
jgi:hypothetical protein